MKKRRDRPKSSEAEIEPQSRQGAQRDRQQNVERVQSANKPAEEKRRRDDDHCYCH